VKKTVVLVILFIVAVSLFMALPQYSPSADPSSSILPLGHFRGCEDAPCPQLAHILMDLSTLYGNSGYLHITDTMSGYRQEVFGATIFQEPFIDLGGNTYKFMFGVCTEPICVSDLVDCEPFYQNELVFAFAHKNGNTDPVYCEDIPPEVFGQFIALIDTGLQEDPVVIHDPERNNTIPLPPSSRSILYDKVYGIPLYYFVCAFILSTFLSLSVMNRLNVPRLQAAGAAAPVKKRKKGKSFPPL